MSKQSNENLQKTLNRFSSKYLKYVGNLRVDGERGPATQKRIRMVKYYLGYGAKRNSNDRDANVTPKFIRRLRHPSSPRYSNPRMLAVGAGRRSYQRRHAKPKRKDKNGISYLDGKPVASWIVPWLQKARANGWNGQLVSGYRTPEYSEQLCYAMCGASSCPGRCAGRATNHAKKDYPYGAIDVSDYYNFGSIQKRIGSPLYNALGARDPVHFSTSGN